MALHNGEDPTAGEGHGVEGGSSQRVDTTAASVAPALNNRHLGEILKRGFSERDVAWMEEQRFLSSLSWADIKDGTAPDGRPWIVLFPGMEGLRVGALLLCFNPKAKFPTYSLRPDPVPEERWPDGERPPKYLYAVTEDRDWSAEELEENPDKRSMPFIPDGLMGPNGGPLGRAKACTEGLPDAMYSTLVLGVPMAAITAPSHLAQTDFGKAKVHAYVSDADLSCAKGLLPQVLNHARRRNLLVARLPFLEEHLEAYRDTPHDLPNEAKAGLEEFGKDHIRKAGGDRAAGIAKAKAALQGIIDSARTPVNFLQWEIEQLGALGVKWGRCLDRDDDLIRSILSATPRKIGTASSLAQSLKEQLGAPKTPTVKQLDATRALKLRRDPTLREWQSPGSAGHAPPTVTERGSAGDEEVADAGAVRFGHIAFEELYGRGENYRSFGPDVYLFVGTHYERRSEAQLRSEAMAFARTYGVPNQKGHITFPYATSTCALEAINFLRMSTATDRDLINPDGYINFRGGTLRITWAGKNRRKLVLEELPHSRDLIFLDPPGCNYDPEAKPDDFDRMASCLEPAVLEMFLELLGATLSVPHVRTICGRIPCGLLDGGGQNGKDNFLAKLSALIGAGSVTRVSMTNFIQFDKGEGAGRFALASLVRSRVNIGSESTRGFKLEGCESIKAAITGEVMSLEEKGEKPFDHAPACGFFFNFNGLPNMDVVKQSVFSRFVIIPFLKLYSDDPKPGQLKADPRFKEDPEWVAENVLPAFANAIFAALQRLVARGKFDLSPGKGAMQEAREKSTHLWQMVEEIGLQEDPDGEVLIKDLWSAMASWYVANGFAKWEGFDPLEERAGSRPFAFLPEARQGDAVIFRARDVVDKLKDRVFPHMKTRTIGGGRKVITGFRLVAPAAGGDGSGGF
jgi:phage/plasmid-associated DNA primase